MLLSGVEDTEITDFFIRNAFPTREEVHQVIGVLANEPAGLSVTQLLQAVNISSGRLDRAIKLLSLESPAPIAKQGRLWQLTPAKLANEFWERAERLTAMRYTEKAQMQEYVALDAGHMEFLIRALDGDLEGVRTSNLPPLIDSVKQETVLKAVEFLRRTNIVISQRRQWANRSWIPDFLQAEAGRALCYWRDAGWGNLVYAGKYTDNRFADELVAPAAQMIREWQPQPAPAWVTCIPSRRHPNLVPDFAERLASTLGLPFRAVLIKTDDRPEQKDMQNSAQQAHNVEGSLGFSQNPLLPGPVLLVDDMVDSGWTFTVAASLLRERGCGAVFPFALANTGNREA